MVNSTSATAAADINEEGLFPTSGIVASEGGEAVAALSAASGEMVNSTSATAAADINEEGLFPTSGIVASEGGAFLDMMVM
jgi:hypothetical protein